MAATATDVARRYHLALLSELALIGLWFALRMLGTDTTQMTVWVIAVVVFCIAAPGSGLVVLAAIAPFNDGLDINRGVGSKTVIAAAILLGVAIRWLIVPAARARPSAPVILASLLLVGTGLGLIRTAVRWGPEFASSAAGTWLSGIATMLLVFIATVWLARRGQRRAVWAALIATTVAGLISLVDFWGDAAIRDGLFGWFVVGQFSADRLTGVIRSPTSTAALVMLPFSVYLAAAVLAPSIRLRMIAAALAAPLLAAAYLTYNRAVFIALYALAVIIGWRIGRRLGIALLVVGIVAGIALVPWYLSVRGQALGTTVAPGQVLIASDQQRLGAWAGGWPDVPRRADLRAGLPGVSPALGPVRRSDPQRAPQRVAAAVRRERDLRRAARSGLRVRHRCPAGSGARLARRRPVRRIPVAVYRGDLQQRLPVQPGHDPRDGHGGDRCRALETTQPAGPRGCLRRRNAGWRAGCSSSRWSGQ